MIPKIIHYCWLSNDSFPEDIQKCMISWKEKLQDYEFILWNFERFDINSSLWVEEAFNAKKYAFAADFIRLYAVYNYGGIYLDSDIEIKKTFDDLLDAEYMFAFESNENKAIEMACFGAVKGLPIIGKIMEYYNDRHFIKADGSYDMIPLPWIVRDILAHSFLSNYPTIYTDDYFTAKCHKTGMVNVSKNTYAVHHFAMSWHSDLRRYLVERRRRIIRLCGDNIFSTLLIWFLNVCSRIKTLGFRNTLSYYVKKHVKGVPDSFDC